MPLSKSDYMLFLKHPAWLWLKKFDKTKLPAIDDNLQDLFDTGNQFETYANQLFPNARKLGFTNYKEYLDLPNQTLDSLASQDQTILQGRLEVDGLTCIFDVLQKIDDKQIDLIEIKASTKAKPEHHYDLAFQMLVLEKAGYTVRNISVIHANKEYVRQGQIDPTKLTTQTDITSKVKALRETTQQQITQALTILKQPEMPDPSPRHVNKIGVPGVYQWPAEWLGIYKTLQPNPDSYNIYNLCSTNPEQIGQLEDAGITNIADIPKELTRNPKQTAQIQTTKTNQQIIQPENIKKFLNNLEYPLYFFDYETYSSVIPQFDGGSPYADYPFQYSLHVLQSPGAELKHLEYLHSENSNPMPGLIAQLKKDIGDIGSKGTILTWYMPYEKGCNKRMAKLYPEHAEFLESLNERINDLMIPFSKMWFVDKDFFGSASVKKVMPVLAPELSYKELNVGDGLLARRIWTEAVLEGENEGENGGGEGNKSESKKRTKIMNDLSKYCTLDTYAMVRILEELKKL